MALSTRKLEARFREDFGVSPSKVVHIFNIPKKVDDMFVAFLAVPFGLINKIVFHKSSQALVELHEIEEAIEMVKYFNMYRPQFYGRNLGVEFSEHECLTYNCIDDINEVANNNREYYLNICRNRPKIKFEILYITLDKAPQLNIDHLGWYKIFGRYGVILRILSYDEHDQHHALVEFQNKLSAHVAKLQLNGASLFGEDDIIEVDFTRNTSHLQVHKPCDNDRDYTTMPLSDQEKAELNNPDFDFPLFSARPIPSLNDDENGMIVDTNVCSLEQDKLLMFFREMKTRTNIDVSPAGAIAATSLIMAFNDGVSQNVVPKQLSIEPTSNVNEDTNDFNCVVLVTNLNPNKSNVDALFKLFGVYGDVMRVKIMMSNRSVALIQYASQEQAQTAINNLENIPLWGTNVHVKMSSTNVIKVTAKKSRQILTKDYSTSGLNRFRGKNPSNLSNIYPPSDHLHLSGIPKFVKEEDLVSLFSNNGYRAKTLEIMPTSVRMAVAVFGSLEEAVQCLVDFHNYQWPTGIQLKISFAKKGANVQK